jgi:hypothetical protein
MRDSVYAEFSKNTARRAYRYFSFKQAGFKSKWNADTLVVPAK